MPTSPYLTLPRRGLHEAIKDRAEALSARIATASLDDLLGIIAELDTLTDLSITPNANDNEGLSHAGE